MIAFQQLWLEGSQAGVEMVGPGWLDWLVGWPRRRPSTLSRERRGDKERHCEAFWGGVLRPRNC